jgi:hypothetical protein
MKQIEGSGRLPSLELAPRMEPLTIGYFDRLAPFPLDDTSYPGQVPSL